MLYKENKKPKRINYAPSPYEPDEDGVQDVGYKLGKLSDGREYRLECWRMDEMVMVTLMFADTGLEAYSRKDMFLLLEAEGILRFTGEKRSVQAARTTDDADNAVWALNIMLANNKGTYGELLVELNRYR